jgi:hypothetical protein
MNININMSEVLTKAWKITWKFKVLWIFGILAGCSTSNRSSFNNGFNSGSGNGNRDFGDGNLPEPLRRFLENPQEGIVSFLSQYGAIIAVVILLLCVLTLLFYFLGVMGKTGLIKGVNKADAGAERLGFGELWGESLPYFWRMFGLSFLVNLPFFIIIVILVVVFFASVFGFAANSESKTALGGLFAALAIFVPAICCLSIVRIVVDMIVEQSKIAIVVEDVGILESLRRGWDIFKRNFLTIVLLAIILGVLGGIVGFVIAIPLLLALAPALGSVLLAGSNAAPAAALAPLAIAGICVLAYLPVLLLAGGIEHTYIQSVWTLTYLRLTGPAPETPAVPPASLPAVETSDAQ